MLMVATLATLTHARQLSEQSVSVCEGIETQQCEADGEYYSCACTVCNLTRSCESNSDLYRCACPHQIAPQFDSNDDDSVSCKELIKKLYPPPPKPDAAACYWSV